MQPEAGYGPASREYGRTRLEPDAAEAGSSAAPGISTDRDESRNTTPRTCSYELFPHDADVGVRGFGRTLEDAFEQAAMAMTAAITDPAKVVAREKLDFDCAASEHGLLLLDWLNALVYAMSDSKMLFGRFQVHIDNNHLHGSAWGELANPRRHEPAVEVKGATLTGLNVSCSADRVWQAQCIIDV